MARRIETPGDGFLSCCFDGDGDEKDAAAATAAAAAVAAAAAELAAADVGAAALVVVAAAGTASAMLPNVNNPVELEEASGAVAEAGKRSFGAAPEAEKEKVEGKVDVGAVEGNDEKENAGAGPVVGAETPAMPLPLTPPKADAANNGAVVGSKVATGAAAADAFDAGVVRLVAAGNANGVDDDAPNANVVDDDDSADPAEARAGANDVDADADAVAEDAEADTDADEDEAVEPADDADEETLPAALCGAFDSCLPAAADDDEEAVETFDHAG